jgi:hypothetical protein
VGELLVSSEGRIMFNKEEKKSVEWAKVDLKLRDLEV